MSTTGLRRLFTTRISVVISCEATLLAALKRLSKDTVIYGASTVVSRFLTFLLVPFYTNVLAPAEYGIVAAVYAYIAFFSIVYGYGMEAAYFKFASGDVERGDRRIFSTSFLSLLCTSLVLTTLIIIIPEFFGSLIDPRATIAHDTLNTVVRLSGAILFCDTLCLLPFAALRLQHKPMRFSAIRFINVVLQVGLNIIFLPVLHWGIAGIFFGNAIAAAITLLFVSPTIASLIAPAFSRETWKKMFAFGMPYLPSGLSLMMLQVIDRPIVQRLTDEAHLGIYNANYRLGIVMMVFVSMFEFAWRPFFLQYAREADAKRVFARVLTYFTVIAAAVFLLVSFFVDPIAHLPMFGRTLINHQYWSGLTIVPIVLLAYVFNGWYTNMIAGVYIENRTKTLPWITGAGAASNVIANFILIPMFGIAGAAWATLFSYALMAGLLWRSTRRYYPVPYEWGRIAIIGAATGAVFVAELFARGMFNGAMLFSARLVLLMVFGASFFVLRFFSPDEWNLLKRIGNRMRGNGADVTP